MSSQEPTSEPSYQHTRSPTFAYCCIVHQTFSIVSLRSPANHSHNTLYVFLVVHNISCASNCHFSVVIKNPNKKQFRKEKGFFWFIGWGDKAHCSGKGIEIVKENTAMWVRIWLVMFSSAHVVEFWFWYIHFFSALCFWQRICDEMPNLCVVYCLRCGSSFLLLFSSW